MPSLRAEILGFTGLLAGGYAGYAAGRRLGDTGQVVALASGAIGGVLLAHLLNRSLGKDEAPQAARGMGDVPPPYRELARPPWWVVAGVAQRTEEGTAPWWPVFIRSVIVPRYVRRTWGTGPAWQSTGAPRCGYELYGKFPHYTLYGGPMNRTEYGRVKAAIESWAWSTPNILGDGAPGYSACSEEVAISVPEGFSPWQWRWVWETDQPDTFQYVQRSAVEAGVWQRRVA